VTGDCVDRFRCFVPGWAGSLADITGCGLGLGLLVFFFGAVTSGPKRYTSSFAFVDLGLYIRRGEVRFFFYIDITSRL
jgi:hypothetical protein